MKNPIQRIKDENNWTSNDIIILSGCSPSTIYANLSGTLDRVSECLLEGLEEAGYNTLKIKKEYAEFRRERKKELLKEVVKGGN